MKNTYRILTLALIFSALTTAKLFAQFQITATGNYLGYVEQYASFTDGMWGGGITVQYYVKPRFAVGLTTRYFTDSRSFGTGSYSTEYQTKALLVSGQIDYFLTQTRLQPYIGVEAGLYKTRETYSVNGSPRKVSSPFARDTYFGYAPKAGLQYALTPTFGLKVDAGYHFLIDGNRTDKFLLLSGGAFFKFGSR
jgi:outer membrane protein W